MTQEEIEAKIVLTLLEGMEQKARQMFWWELGYRLEKDGSLTNLSSTPPTIRGIS